MPVKASPGLHRQKPAQLGEQSASGSLGVRTPADDSALSARALLPPFQEGAGKRRRQRQPPRSPSPLKSESLGCTAGRATSLRCVSARIQPALLQRGLGTRPCGHSPCLGTFCWRPSPSPPPTTSCPRTLSWRCWARVVWARAVSGTKARQVAQGQRRIPVRRDAGMQKDPLPVASAVHF